MASPWHMVRRRLDASPEKKEACRTVGLAARGCLGAQHSGRSTVAERLPNGFAGRWCRAMRPVQGTTPDRAAKTDFGNKPRSVLAREPQRGWQAWLFTQRRHRHDAKNTSDRHLNRRVARFRRAARYAVPVAARRSFAAIKLPQDRHGWKRLAPGGTKARANRMTIRWGREA